MSFNKLLRLRQKGCCKTLPFQPNDPHMGFKVLGLIPYQFSICVSQSWPFLYGPVRIFSEFFWSYE